MSDVDLKVCIDNIKCTHNFQLFLDCLHDGITGADLLVQLRSMITDMGHRKVEIVDTWIPFKQQPALTHKISASESITYLQGQLLWHLQASMKNYHLAVT